jgi:hypothetical protein
LIACRAGVLQPKRSPAAAGGLAFATGSNYRSCNRPPCDFDDQFCSPKMLIFSPKNCLVLQTRGALQIAGHAI